MAVEAQYIVNLTCTAASGSRKRSRDTADITQQHPHLDSFVQHIASSNNQIPTPSTSGRSALPSPSQHGAEIDALIRLQNAKLRSGLVEIQKRHYRRLLPILEQQSARTLSAKDAEIEGAKRRQAELEVKLRQLAAEKQMWFTAARNSEAVVSVLKARLDQALRRQGAEASHVADDAESCCDEGGCDDPRRLCRACGEKDVLVLLLPCRHLCLCVDCESATATCPVCSAPKNCGLQVLME